VRQYLSKKPDKRNLFIVIMFDLVSCSRRDQPLSNSINSSVTICGFSVNDSSTNLTLSPMPSVLPEQSVVYRGSQSCLESSQSVETSPANTGRSFGGNSKNQENQFLCNVHGCAVWNKLFKQKYSPDINCSTVHSSSF
jgi:hypothetical protein